MTIVRGNAVPKFFTTGVHTPASQTTERFTLAPPTMTDISGTTINTATATDM